MEEKTKTTLNKLLPYAKWIFLAVLVIIGGLMTLQMNRASISKECCQKVCESIGTTCESNQGSNIFCSYNYADRGHPEITEIFRFIVNKTAACNPEEKVFVASDKNISNTNDPPRTNEVRKNRSSEMPTGL